MAAATRVRGTIVYIGTTASDHAADTYTEITGGRAVSGSIGAEWGTVDVTTIKDTYKQELKTVADAGDMELGGNYIHNDAGQVALAAAALDDSDPDVYNFKVALPSGRLWYVKARVMSFRRQLGTNANVAEFRAKLSLIDAIVDAAAA